MHCQDDFPNKPLPHFLRAHYSNIPVFQYSKLRSEAELSSDLLIKRGIMKRPLFTGLHARLMFLVLIIIVPLLGLFIYQGIEERNEKRLQSLNEVRRLARNASTLYSKTIIEARQILFTLSKMPQVQRQDPDACSKIFADLLKQTESYTGFIATKLNGDVFASVPGSAKSVNLADRPWFQRIKQTRDFVIGEYLIGRLSAKPVIILAYPVLDSTGRLMAILSTGLDIERLQKTLVNIELPDGVNLTVFDSNGTIILRFPDPEKFVGKKLFEKSIIKAILSKSSVIEEGVGLDGRPRIFGYTTVGSGSEVIYIKVSIPKQIAFADVKRDLVKDLTWLGLLAVLAFLGAWLFGSILILTPMHRLIEVTKIVADGDLTVRMGRSYAMGELSLLAYNFDQMADSLQHRQEKLQESEKKFRNLIEILPVGVSMSTPEEAVSENNQAILKILGYDSKEEFQKIPASAHYDNHKDRERFVELHKKGLVKDFEARFKRKDGTVFWGRVTSTTQTTVTGATQFINVFEDITERKQAEKALKESEEKYRHLVESTSDWVWVCDVEGRQTFANEAVKTILGYEIHEIIGTLAASLMHPEDWERGREAFNRSVEEKKGWGSHVARWKHKDGTVKFLESMAKPVLDPQGNLVGFTGIDRDVTKRRMVEEERKMFYEKLKSLNLELEDKVQERTRELEATVRKADEANRAKSDFLSNMSHELRTPLNAVIGFSQVLMEKYFGELNEKQETYVGHILESGKHLLELISDILDLAKIESGKLELELELTGVKIGDLLEDSLVIIKEKAKKHDISLDLHIVPELADLEITADERKLKQVMYNLLSNAVKFTPDGGSVRVSARIVDCRLSIDDLRARPNSLNQQPTDINHQSLAQTWPNQTAQEKVINGETPESKVYKNNVAPGQASIINRKCVEVCVADSGIGLSPENQEKIFEEFHQVQDGLQSKPGGTGLGLSLSRRFVEMHEGRLWVESEGEGRGSRFSFIVPVIPEHLEEVEPEAEATLLSHLSRAISLSEQQNKPATLCRLLADEEHLKRGRKRVKRVLEEEKRGHDFLVIDQDYNFYLILQQTDRQQAKVTCDRFSEKLEGMLEGLKASWSMVTFPENGEDAATLLEKIGIQQE